MSSISYNVRPRGLGSDNNDHLFTPIPGGSPTQIPAFIRHTSRLPHQRAVVQQGRGNGYNIDQPIPAIRSRGLTDRPLTPPMTQAQFWRRLQAARHRKPPADTPSTAPSLFASSAELAPPPSSNRSSSPFEDDSFDDSFTEPPFKSRRFGFQLSPEYGRVLKDELATPKVGRLSAVVANPFEGSMSSNVSTTPEGSPPGTRLPESIDQSTSSCASTTPEVSPRPESVFRLYLLADAVYSPDHDHAGAGLRATSSQSTLADELARAGAGSTNVSTTPEGDPPGMMSTGTAIRRKLLSDGLETPERDPPGVSMPSLSRRASLTNQAIRREKVAPKSLLHRLPVRPSSLPKPQTAGPFPSRPQLSHLRGPMNSHPVSNDEADFARQLTVAGGSVLPYENPFKLPKEPVSQNQNDQKNTIIENKAEEKVTARGLKARTHNPMTATKNPISKLPIAQPVQASRNGGEALRAVKATSNKSRAKLTKINTGQVDAGPNVAPSAGASAIQRGVILRTFSRRLKLHTTQAALRGIQEEDEAGATRQGAGESSSGTGRRIFDPPPRLVNRKWGR